MEVVIPFVWSCFAVASSSKCDTAAPLPKPSPISNIKGISGMWYQTVSSTDFLSAQYSCATISEVHVNSEFDGFTGLITNLYREINPQSFHIHQRTTAHGYLERMKIDNLEKSSHRLSQSGKAKAAEEFDDVSANFKVFSPISDGSRHFGYVNCTPEGWVAWIYTPQKVLTAEELLYIHNELVKHGIHTELRLGGCGNINP